MLHQTSTQPSPLFERDWMITKALDAKQAVQRALQTIDANMITFGDRFPDDTTIGNVYTLRRARNGFDEGGNFGWTTSFWPGMLWLASLTISSRS